jgi:putative transposase
MDKVTVPTFRKSFKFRLYPNANQERELGVILETHRRLYNQCLEMRNVAYAGYNLGITSFDQSNWFKNERKHNPWYAKLNFSSAQGTMRRLDKAFQSFFRRVKAGQKPGYPRFRAYERFDSVEFPTYGDGIRLKDKLRVQNVGMIRCKQHRKVEGTVKTAALKREGGKWYVILSCDLGAIVIPPSQDPPVGIDMGLESFLTTSDGEHVVNPRFLKNELPALRRAQRAVSRKNRGGRNRKKAVKVVSKLHARVANCRKDHHHKAALRIIKRYGLVAAERLSTSNMLKNRRLARSIQDAGWSQFLGILEHKAASAGVRVVEVDPRYTSQICHSCGQIKPKLLSERWHSCSCGVSVHRDVNSAKVILDRALVSLARTEPAGANGRLLTSVV